MGFLSDNGIQLRAWYNNVVYTLMLLLGALTLASLNQDVQTSTADDADYLYAYKNCDLKGATAVDGDTAAVTCPNLAEDSDEAHQLQQIFNITVAIVVVNSIFWIVGIAAHWITFTAYAQTLQWPMSIINIGLFGGLLGWFNSFGEDLTTEANLENSVFFKDYNIYTIAIVGTVLAIADLVVFGALYRMYFNGPCTEEKYQ